MAYLLLHYTPCVLLIVACLSVTPSYARLLNITNMENCQEYKDAAVVQLKTVKFHVDPATGVCDTVHGDFVVKAGDDMPRILIMTLFKCPDPMSSEICLSNPTKHEETLGCDRLTGDDSGPWAMFSEAIKNANCGKNAGVFSLDYSTLSLNNLMNYLDIHDSDFGRYRMRMYFHSTQTDSIRACLDVDFKLITA